MPSSAISSRMIFTRRTGWIGNRSSVLPTSRCLSSASRTLSKYEKSQCFCGAIASFRRQIAFATSPVTSICGK